MPRHYDPTRTPPEKRRNPKGSLVGEARFNHTATSLFHEKALQKFFRLSKTATYHRVLAFAYELSRVSTVAEVQALLAKITKENGR